MKIDNRANVTPNQIQQKGYRTSAEDTLRTVASKFQVSSSSLAKANNLLPDAKLVQGMTLIIPKAKASSGKSGNAQSTDVFTHAPRTRVGRGALVTYPDALRRGPISPAEIEKRFHTPPGPGPRPPDPND